MSLSSNNFNITSLLETIHLQADTLATQARTVKAQNKQIESLTQQRFSSVSHHQVSLSPDAVAYETGRGCLIEDKDMIEEKSKNIVIVGLEGKESDLKTAAQGENLIAKLVGELNIKELSDAFKKSDVKHKRH